MKTMTQTKQFGRGWKLAGAALILGLALGANAATLSLQLKADDLVLSDGAAVSAWGSAVQATGSKQPTYKTAIINDRSVVRFDGDDTLQIPSIGLDSDTTIFLVGKFTTSGMLLEQTPNANSSDGFYLVGDQGWSTVMTRSGGAIKNGYNFGSGHWTGTDYTLIQVVFDTVTDAWSASTNGTALSASQQNPGDIPASSTATDALNIMSRNQNSLFTAGDIAELRIYSGTMTESERSTISGELFTAYFIPEPSALMLLSLGGLLLWRRQS